jgi:hypothetical protein
MEAGCSLPSTAIRSCPAAVVAAPASGGTAFKIILVVYPSQRQPQMDNDKYIWPEDGQPIAPATETMA